MLRIRFPVEIAHRIRAEQLERVCLGQLVPELFEPDRSDRVAVTPQQIDQLTVRADRFPIRPGLQTSNHSAHRLLVVYGPGTIPYLWHAMPRRSSQRPARV